MVLTGCKTVFLVDLPRLPNEQHGEANTSLTPFAHELIHFLEAQKIDEQAPEGAPSIVAAVKKFDFTNTKHLAFIHTICGSQLEEEIHSTGFPLLAKAVRTLGVAAGAIEVMQVDFAASSIGSALTPAKIEEMYRALRGKVDKPTSAKNPTTQNTTSPLSTRFRVFFPSLDTVQHSKHGEAGAGTIFMSPAWDKPEFPRPCFQDYVSTRTGLLSHNKVRTHLEVGESCAYNEQMILVRTAKSAFVYTGSANFSQSAWGTLTWGRVEKCPKLTCANWECGELIRIEDIDEQLVARSIDENQVLPMAIFKTTLDIPFTWPSQKYEGSPLRPWIQKLKS